MRHHAEINYSPDGFDAGFVVAKAPVMAARHDEDFDDGLVHGHGWAMATPARYSAPVVQASRHEGDYDDGLVHSHGWATAA